MLSEEPLPAPAIDPDLFGALAAFGASLPDGEAEMTTSTLPQIRAMLATLPKLTDAALSREGQFTVEHQSAAGLNGAPSVPLIVIRPRAAQPTAVLVWVHGGGMVFGDYRDGLAEMLDYAEATTAAVVSVQYRLAPESTYPGPIEDCMAAVAWVESRASDIGVDPGRIVLVGGSAGGGLAASTALRRRDEGNSTLLGLMLLAPMLDHRNDTESLRQLPNPAVWSRSANGFGWRSLLGSSIEGGSAESPATARSLHDLPESYVDVGGADGFRDEDASFAVRMSRDGVLVEFHIWAGGYHGFEGMASDAAVSHAARAARASWLRRVIARK